MLRFWSLCKTAKQVVLKERELERKEKEKETKKSITVTVSEPASKF
jgi:hypothetical protein